MTEHQLLLQIERLNDQIGHSVEGLIALAHMIEFCDEVNAPMPFQLAELIRSITGYTATACNGIDRSLNELKPLSHLESH